MLYDSCVCVCVCVCGAHECTCCRKRKQPSHLLVAHHKDESDISATVAQRYGGFKLNHCFLMQLAATLTKMFKVQTV